MTRQEYAQVEALTLMDRARSSLAAVDLDDLSWTVEERMEFHQLYDRLQRMTQREEERADDLLSG